MPGATLQQLELLHREVAALARAGVPLDRGLRSLASELPGRAGAQAADMAQRLERGESLESVLGSARDTNRRVAAAVIAAGVRANRLPEALETLVASSQSELALQRRLGVELIYPFVLLWIGLALLTFSTTSTTPRALAASEQLQVDDAFTRAIDAALQAATPWLAVLWIATAVLTALGLVAIWRAASSRPRQHYSQRGFGRWHREKALARFCETLGLLVDQRMELPEALPLAGEAAGWGDLARAARAASERSARGERLTVEPPLPAVLPLLLASPEGGRMLRRQAALHRQKAERQARWLSRWLPLVLSLVVGLAMLGLLAVVNLGPWLNALLRMTFADWWSTDV
jgi:type II secretory pathway component PulF